MTITPHFDLFDRPCKCRSLSREEQLSRIASVIEQCDRPPSPQEVAEAEFVLNAGEKRE